MKKTHLLSVGLLLTAGISTMATAGTGLPFVSSNKFIASGTSATCSATDTLESCRQKVSSDWAAVTGHCEFDHMWHTSFACMSYKRSDGSLGEFVCSWQSANNMGPHMLPGVDNASSVCNSLPYPGGMGTLSSSSLSFATPVDMLTKEQS